MIWNILIILLLLCSGCVQGNVTLLDSSNYPASAYVEVLKEKPARPYKTIALVKATGPQGSGEAELLGVLQGQARSVGADAILPLAKEENASGGLNNPCSGGVVGEGREKVTVLKAYAIKYQ
ncbi:MAG TPA: hypothetical protein VJA64_04140 [Desulfobaccales bacterium]|nr:hypothetical protein [Desulfobaccales bacterium]